MLSCKELLTNLTKAPGERWQHHTVKQHCWSFFNKADIEIAFRDHTVDAISEKMQNGPWSTENKKQDQVPGCFFF
jgi:hypothetical protein